MKGCTAKCPLCGSKCSLVNEHVDHECAHHILPAFHGRKLGESKLTWLKMCRSAENVNWAPGWHRGDEDSQKYPSLAALLEAFDVYRPWKTQSYHLILH